MKERLSTIENLDEIIEYTKEGSSRTEIILSNLCLRKDKPDLEKAVRQKNAELKEFCRLAT